MRGAEWRRPGVCLREGGGGRRRRRGGELPRRLHGAGSGVLRAGDDQGTPAVDGRHAS